MKTKITAVAMVALMVLTIFASVIPASAADVTSLEVRGTVIDTGVPGAISWSASNWAAFYYDINEPTTATETLAYADDGVAAGLPIATVAELYTNNVMDKGELTYTTGDVGINYKVDTAVGPLAKIPGGQYGVIGWMAEKFVAIDQDSQKITKLIFEQGADDKKTLRAGEAWDLGNGYILTPEQIDVEGNKVWLTLSKDGVVIEDEILDTQLAANDATFVAKADFASKTDVIYFVTYVDAAFRGTATDLVQLKYTWLIDKTDITEIATDDTFGNFKCTLANSNAITLSNDNAVTLNVDDKISFMGDMYFQVSKAGKGSDTGATGTVGYLFYPAKDVIAPGPYEVRGIVIDTGVPGVISWSANNWAAFYYDINEPTTATETLAYADDGVAAGLPIATVAELYTNNVMDKGELTYTTGDVGINYKVDTAVGPLAKIPGGQYGVIGWMAEKFVAIDQDSQKITKLILEQGADDKKTLRAGEAWDLGNGYILTPEQIDVEGNKVWLTLSKDGAVVEDEILDTQLAANDATFVAKADFAGKTDAIYFVTYVDAAFRGTATDLVQLKYTWLIDKTDITEIATDDTFGNFKCTLANSNAITLSNDNAVTLNVDDKISFMENMYFQVSKAGKGSDTGATGTVGYLFYPAKEVTIAGEVPAVEEPAVEEPAVEEPAVEEPAVEEPAVGEPAVGEPAPAAPAVEPEAPEAPVEPPEEEPGFEAIFAIAGLLAVAFLVRRNK